MPTFTRPFLYKKQEDAIYSNKRFTVIEATSKCGKTVGAIVWIIEKALLGPSNRNYWWVAPVFSQSDIAFRRLKTYLSPGSFNSNEQKMSITLINGAVIWFRTGDNPDTLYGEDVWGCVIDEASRVKEEAWHAIRSTLSATQGEVLAIGNVKGRRNWFFKLARTAEAEMKEDNNEYHYAKLTIWDAIEGGVMSEREVQSLQRQLPEAIFKELYLAEPADDFGNPFGESHIDACIKTLSTKPAVCFGVDVARKRDWFVVIGLDEDGTVCFFDRWRNKPWHVSEEMTKKIVGKLIPAVLDATGNGDRVIEEFQSNDYENFEGFIFSPVSKQRLIEGLSISIQAHEIGFPEGPLKGELDNFTYEVTRTGVLYQAPEGQYDDCVCALALAVKKWREIRGSFSNASYAGRGTINNCIASGRTVIEFNNSVRYSAFFAVPGSTSDRPALAIAHLSQDNTAILDLLEEFPSNTNLDEVIIQVAATLKKYELVKVEGDHFAGVWPKEYFSKYGVIYEPIKLTQSEVYRDFMPLLSSGEVELLDNPKLIMQFNALERSVTKVGRDSVGTSLSDNLARAVSSLIVTASRGTWATWQKLASRADFEKQEVKKRITKRDFEQKLNQIVREASYIAQPIRKVAGNYVAKEGEETIYLPISSFVRFPEGFDARALTAGRWVVPFGTRQINRHVN